MPLFWLPNAPSGLVWQAGANERALRHTPQNRNDGREVEGGRELSIARLETMIAGQETMVAKSETNYSTATGRNGMKGERGKKIRGECMTTVTPLLSTIIQNIMI